MNQVEGLLILTAIPLALLLCGYWLAALVTDTGPEERLALALPCGLALLLAAAVAVNFFRPLSGAWAWACLAPALFTVFLPRSRAGLRTDAGGILRANPRPVALTALGFFALLLWPTLRTATSIFYDGTSNHDSFFWIAAAEHLKRHTYLAAPVVGATQPLSGAVAAVVGLQPAWGRVGAEDLLALTSSLVGASPLKVYLYATASLALVWAALLYLALRTFVTDTPAKWTGVALVALQPVFVFFHGNANLPNLLGALMGTATIIAVERAARSGPARATGFTAWATLAALGWHGLLCSYPEMAPFVLLPCALLWWRPWFTTGARAYARTGLLIAASFLAGTALNPATTLRAIHGFQVSFITATAGANWANLFEPLVLAEYIPALSSLSISGAKELGVWLGWPLSVLLVAVFALVLRHSRDRFGLCAGLAGGAALLAYTIATDFAYGWQKTVQFSGIFCALVFPVAALDTLWRLRPATAGARRLGQGAIAALVLFFAYATVMNCRDIYKWSDRKVISADWFALRDRSRVELAHVPVLVEAATFRMAFFHSMWAAYFLPDSDIYFGARGDESGGYLRHYVVNEATQPLPRPVAVLVGRPWADTFDANSPRVLTGAEYVLLQKSNRVFRLTGTSPPAGPPDLATDRITLEILPHSTGNLLLDLAPRGKAGWPAGDWRFSRRAGDAPEATGRVTGPSPWHLRIPLVAGRRNMIEITLAHEEPPATPPQFTVRNLRIEDSP